MKLAILSESPADEAAIAVLAAAVLGGPFERVQPALRARGWPNVAQVLPAVIRHLHFNTLADAIMVVVDSDDSPVHTVRHDAPGYFHPLCRLCRLRAIFRQTVKNLPPARGREGVLRGAGVAVPAIEAWLLCGRDPQVSEAAWLNGQIAGHLPYTRAELKWRTYGTDRPNLPHEMRCAVEAAQRHGRDLRRLENDFPGFAVLARDVRSWVGT
ncbi:MAG: hypothetical protein WCL04_00925 [Verrucomicrobiota bacterium]